MRLEIKRQSFAGGRPGNLQTHRSPAGAHLQVAANDGELLRPDQQQAGVLRGLATPLVPRVRPHCRFRNRGTEYVSKSGINWMSGGAKRQCDRALVMPLVELRHALLDVVPQPEHLRLRLELRSACNAFGVGLSIRCVWGFRHRSVLKDCRFPFKLPNSGTDNSKRIVGERRGVARGGAPAPRRPASRAAWPAPAAASCPDRKPPCLAVKRPARPYKTATERIFTVGDANTA